MCVVAFAFDTHPRWQLVLAGNRDEFHARAADPLAHWADARHVIAGRDRQAGGGWLGVSTEGRIAVVTNIRAPAAIDANKKSRGALVGDWLAQGRAPPIGELAAYNPFNLMLSDRAGARILSNLPTAQQTLLDPGVHGLSNGHPGEAWPRRDAMVGALADWLRDEADRDALFSLLRDESLLDDGGIPIFVRGPVYGTRCSTVLLVDRAGRGWIGERRFAADGRCTGDAELGFQWPQ